MPTLRVVCKPTTYTQFPFEFSASGFAGLPDFYTIKSGISVGAPTDYVDFTAGDETHRLDLTSHTRVDGPAGTSISGVGYNGNYGSGYLGQDVWFSVFSQSAPAAGDVPLCVAGPFPIET